MECPEMLNRLAGGLAKGRGTRGGRKDGEEMAYYEERERGGGGGGGEGGGGGGGGGVM